MNEEKDERLAKAAMKSMHIFAPASLKADLKRLARNRAVKPSMWGALREALAGGAWAYGAGAAFAAAAVAVVLLKAVPPRPAPGEALVQTGPLPSSELAALWSDDDGGDHD